MAQSSCKHHHIFSRILKRAEPLDPVNVAVVFPCSKPALMGAQEIYEHSLAIPILIGPEQEIVALADQARIDISGWEILQADDEAQAAAAGVALCREGRAQALMKGSLHTDHLMHAVMDDKLGLRTMRQISHIFVFDVPAYPKMLLVSDAAINLYPDLQQKADIVRNTIDLAGILGLENPRVAILSAVETINPKLQSTIDAAALCKMADRDQIVGATLDGPLALDNAISPAAARIKHIHSPVAGHADILIVPDMEAGNMLAKQLEYLANADSAGIVMGAKVPIILTSRADSAQCRLASGAVAALIVDHNRKKA